MGAEFHATAAVNADKGIAGRVQVDGIHWTSPGAFPAANTQLPPDHHAAPFSLRKGACGASHGTRRRIAGQARLGLEASGKTARRPDPDSRFIPGKLLVHQPGTGQGTRVTTDASFHTRCGQNLHANLLFQEF